MVALKQQGRLIIFFAMLVLLSSCSGGGGDFAISSTSSEISQISATGGSVIEEREESSVNHEEQDSDGYSDWTGYTGYSDGGRNYHYLYGKGDDEARNRRWEEIIVQFADDFLDPLRGHPYLTNRDITRAVIDENFSLSFSHPDLNRVNVFDEKRRNIFTESVNSLISDIHNMTDMEIAFSLRTIIAKINESHTRFLYLTRYAYPLRFKILCKDERNHVYCSVAPSEHSNILGCKLISINGYGMSELAERLAPYSDAPDDADPVSNILHNGLLYEWDALQIGGVIGWSDDTAVFTFESHLGEHITATIPKMELNRWSEFFVPENENKMYVEISKPYYRSRNETFWYEMIDDYTLYIRVSTFREDLGMFPSEIKKIAEEKGTVTTVILDLRDNTGGYYKPGFSAHIRNINAENVYIFTNRLTQSAGIVTAQGLRKNCSNVTVVGEYGWHTNFLGDTDVRKIGNVPTYEEMEYTIPRRAYQTSENTDWVTGSTQLFTPDVFLYFEYEDFIEGRDTFLEWIKNR